MSFIYYKGKPMHFKNAEEAKKFFKERIKEYKEKKANN